MTYDSEQLARARHDLIVDHLDDFNVRLSMMARDLDRLVLMDKKLDTIEAEIKQLGVSEKMMHDLLRARYDTRDDGQSCGSGIFG